MSPHDDSSSSTTITTRKTSVSPSQSSFAVVWIPFGISLLFIILTFIQYDVNDWNHQISTNVKEEQIIDPSLILSRNSNQTNIGSTIVSPQTTNITYHQFDKNTIYKTAPRRHDNVSTGNASNSIDWDDVIFDPSDILWDSSPIIDLQHKLMFVTIPKVACTIFKQLFRRMKSIPGWRRDDKYQPHDPQRNRLTYLRNLPRSKQEEIMTSSEWIRAVFVRNPYERLLSAYLDKALGVDVGLDVRGEYIKIKCCDFHRKYDNNNNDNDNGHTSPKIAMAVTDLSNVPQHCLSLLPYDKPLDEQILSFETFIRSFLVSCHNEHWSPQYERLKPQNWKFINFVGYFDTLKEDTQRLLQQQRIDVYQRYGQNGWGRYGNESIFSQNHAYHATQSSSKMRRYYGKLPTDVQELLQQYYQVDFEHFNISSSSSSFMGSSKDLS